MGILDFFSQEAGQRRRKWLNETVNDGLSYYIPPNLRPAVQATAQMNPIQGMHDAMQASGVVFDPEQTAEARKRAAIDMGFEVAMALTPAALASRGYLTPVQGVMESLLGGSPAQEQITQDAANLLSDVKYAGRSAAEGDLRGVFDALSPSREARGLSADVTLFRGQSPIPGTEAQLERAVDAVPEVENVLPYLTPEEAATVTYRTAPNLEAAFRATNTDDLIGAAVGGSPKLGWYRESGAALNTVFEDDTRRFATLLAALSPQTSVEMNMQNAVNTWSNWVKAGRPKDPNEILEIMGRSVLGDKGTDSVLDAWKNNAIRALSAPEGTPGDMFRLSGPKVDSFGFASSGDLDRFTNDAWQANLTGIPQDLYARSSGKSLPGYSAGYLGSSAAGRKAASQMSDILGEEIMPSEVQETGWSFAKALYEQAAEGRPSGGPTALEIYKEGLLSPSRIADVPDFATLLQEDIYGGPLRELGYGSSIDEAARSAGRIGTRDISAAANPTGAERVARRLDALYNHRKFVSETEPFRSGSFNFGNATGKRQNVLTPYGKPSGGFIPLDFGAKGKMIQANPQFASVLEKSNAPAPDFFQLASNPESRSAFVQKMRANQASRGPIGKSVDVYDPKDYKGYKMFTTNDGSAGFAISPSGELSSVVADKRTPYRGFSDAALAAATQNGAKWLNAFDTVLPQKYARFGFKPVARLKFDEGFARSEWGDEAVDTFMANAGDFNDGKPDLVFMVFDPKFKGTVANNVGGKIVTDYDAGMKAVNQAISRQGK